MLGLVTDIAPGYDHHLSHWCRYGRLAWHGDALLRDSQRHLGLPNAEDVREG